MAASARGDRGYAMAALLVGMSVMGIMLGIAMPAWRSVVQREREAELIFRGEQYAQAIALYNRRTGGYPTSMAQLREGRYIRQLYKDPITNGEFQPVFVGQGVPFTAPGAGRGGQGAAPGAGLGMQPAAGAQPFGRGQQAGVPGASPFPAAPAGRAGQPGALGQPGAFGQPGAPGQPGVGPIIGVVSRSTGEAMRLYNGRGKYNEWVFVSTAATQQAGAPAGGPAGQQGGPGVRGRGPQQPGPGGRGLQPGQGPTPFDRPVPGGRGPGGFQPSPFGQPGRPGGPAPGGTTNPFTPGRGRF